MIQYIYRRYGRERAGLAARGGDLSHPLGDPRDRQGVRPVGGRDRRAQQHRLGPRARRRSARSARAPPGSTPSEPTLALMLKLAGELVGFPRHLTQHSGGFVIARDRLDEIAPIMNAAMEDRTIDRMGQGRPRRARHAQDRRAGARHADRDAQEPRSCLEAHYGERLSARLDPVGGGVRLRDDPARRHHRRVPDRKPRADVDAAAPQAGEFLRPGHRGGDRASRADPGRHGPSLSAPPPGARADGLSVAGAGGRCSARRSACRCSRSRR